MFANKPQKVCRNVLPAKKVSIKKLLAHNWAPENRYNTKGYNYQKRPEKLGYEKGGRIMEVGEDHKHIQATRSIILWDLVLKRPIKVKQIKKRLPTSLCLVIEGSSCKL